MCLLPAYNPLSHTFVQVLAPAEISHLRVSAPALSLLAFPSISSCLVGGVFWQTRCVLSTPILTQWVSHISTGKGLVPQDCTHTPNTTCKWSPPNYLHFSLADHTFREVLYVWVPFYLLWRIPLQNSQRKRCTEQGMEWRWGAQLPCPLQVGHLPSTSMHSPTWKFPNSCCSKFL